MADERVRCIKCDSVQIAVRARKTPKYKCNGNGCGAEFGDADLAAKKAADEEAARQAERQRREIEAQWTARRAAEAAEERKLNEERRRREEQEANFASGCGRLCAIAQGIAGRSRKDVVKNLPDEPPMPVSQSESTDHSGMQAFYWIVIFVGPVVGALWGGRTEAGGFGAFLGGLVGLLAVIAGLVIVAFTLNFVSVHVLAPRRQALHESARNRWLDAAAERRRQEADLLVRWREANPYLAAAQELSPPFTPRKLVIAARAIGRHGTPEIKADALHVMAVHGFNPRYLLEDDFSDIGKVTP